VEIHLLKARRRLTKLRSLPYLNKQLNRLDALSVGKESRSHRDSVPGAET